MYVVSIMPCTAKKYEVTRQEMATDVDAVLTTRELARMIKDAGIEFVMLLNEEFDSPMGLSSGAADIFGTTGGVMEAALRTVYEVVTGEELEDINLTAVRGLEGIKEATVRVGDIDVKVAVTNSLKNAKVMMDMIKAGEADYHFVEVMCCPGGCIGGGGQPRPTTNAIREQRIAGIYSVDEKMAIRKSHKNPAVLKLYDDFLGEPNSHKAHELLHTKYFDRSNDTRL
jgi:NADH-quinone oxidoreductase subunit G/NADP-reducing hydrogenase subunit HndD